MFERAIDSTAPVLYRSRRMKILGAIIFIAGLVFFLGNIIGFFRTFPGVGYITMAVGGFLYKKASDEE